MSRRSARWVAMAATLAVLSTSCAQVARISTEPEGAHVYVNGTYLGKSPTVYRYRSGIPQTYHLRLEKEGYEEARTATMEQGYRADHSLALLILGIFPFFFSARLEDQEIFHLRPLEAPPL